MLDLKYPTAVGVLQAAASFAAIDIESIARNVTMDACAEQYLIDFEEECPCGGSGTVLDPDYEPELGSFDPYSEFSSMPRLHGRGRGQL